MTPDLDAVRAMVTRYQVSVGRTHVSMQPQNDGPWIAATDYDALAAEVDALRDRVKTLERRDREAANHAESVICMRTHFTGEPPYVGWEGLGLALREALDERDAGRATIAALDARVEDLTEMVGRAAVWVPQYVRSWHADKDALSQKDTPDA